MVWIFLIITFFIVFGLLNILYKKTNAYMNRFFYTQKLGEMITDDLEMVNIGSGPSYYAFDYQYIPIRGCNLSIPPQSVYHDYALLNHYNCKLKKGAIIIIITCPLSFAQNKFHRTTAYRNRYYNILSENEVDGGTSVEYFICKYFPLLLNPKQIIRIFKDVKPAEESKPVINLSKDAEKVLKGWIENNYVHDLKDATQREIHLDEFERVIIEYQKMLQLCQEKEWRPFFVIPPVSQPIREVISTEFRKSFVMDNIDKANIINVPVLDYFYSDQIADDKYFLNSIFLNGEGRKKFMKLLWKDIKMYI